MHNFLYALSRVALKSDKTYVDNELALRSDKLTTYTKLQVDGLVSNLAPTNNPSFTGTVSGITKSMLSLSNVDDTSDLNKPISTLTQSALNGKQAIITDGGLTIAKTSGLQTILDSKWAQTLNDTYISGSITATSPFYTGFTATDFPTWIVGAGKTGNFTSNTSYPITNYGVVSNYASQLTLTSNTSSWDLSLNGLALVSGRALTVSVWVKLGTASNFAMTFNNTQAWNTLSGKTFTTSDGLNTSTYTQVTLTTGGSSGGFMNFVTGCHLQSGQTQQSGGTVFTYGWQMIINDNTLSLTSNVLTSGYIKSVPMCFSGRLVTNLSAYTAGSPFGFSSIVDPYSRWSVANKRFTASVAGYYQVEVCLATGGSTTSADIWLYKNGGVSTFLARYSASASYNTCGSCIINLAVADYIQISSNTNLLLTLDYGTLVIKLL
jgi:hypothetical protein